MPNDSKLDIPAIAPLVKLDGQYNLELFHGSTIAFKDMAFIYFAILYDNSC